MLKRLLPWVHIRVHSSRGELAPAVGVLAVVRARGMRRAGAEALGEVARLQREEACSIRSWSVGGGRGELGQAGVEWEVEG